MSFIFSWCWSELVWSVVCWEWWWSGCFVLPQILNVSTAHCVLFTRSGHWYRLVFSIACKACSHLYKSWVRDSQICTAENKCCFGLLFCSLAILSISLLSERPWAILTWFHVGKLDYHESVVYCSLPFAFLQVFRKVIFYIQLTFLWWMSFLAILLHLLTFWLGYPKPPL